MKKEANIISWKIVIDESNKIITEINQFPEDKIDEVFKQDAPYIKSILLVSKPTLESLHNNIKKHLQKL